MAHLSVVWCAVRIFLAETTQRRRWPHLPGRCGHMIESTFPLLPSLTQKRDSFSLIAVLLSDWNAGSLTRSLSPTPSLATFLLSKTQVPATATEGLVASTAMETAPLYDGCVLSFRFPFIATSLWVLVAACNPFNVTIADMLVHPSSLLLLQLWRLCTSW